MACQIQIEAYKIGENDILDQMVYDDPLDAFRFMREIIEEVDDVDYFYISEICEGGTVDSTSVNISHMKRMRSD